MELNHTATRSGRLSSILREDMEMSLGLMNKLKWQNKLLVNGAPQHTDFSVNPGDVITVTLDEPIPDYPAEDGDLTILYEDEHILAVDKPAGMLIHPSRSRLTGTLANYVLGYYQKTNQQSAFHPLTRLDRDTFGVVLLAKNSHIHALLSAQGFQKETGHWSKAVRKQIAALSMPPLPDFRCQVFCAMSIPTENPLSRSSRYYAAVQITACCP